MCGLAKENKNALRKTVVPEAFDEFMQCKKKPKTDQPTYLSFTKGQGLSHHALGKLTTSGMCAHRATDWDDCGRQALNQGSPFADLYIQGESCA
jgi:hypothetical protein